MKKTTICLATSVCASLVASGAPYFHTEFDEASLGDITGLNIDTPNTDTTGGDSGTISLDTVDGQLDLTANAANLWAAREGAPIAWVAAPTVAVGETWYVETQINMVNDPGGAAAGYDQGGITFYGGPDGANPGATDNFALLLNDWNNWGAQNAAFSVGGAANASNAALNEADTNIFLRVEITEGGATDTYNFFYKENAEDAWSQLDGIAIDRMGSFDNSRVGLVLKSHNNNANGAAQFDYLTVDVISLVSGTDTDADGLDDGWEIASTAAPGNLTDLNGLKDGSGGSGADSGDFDGDGLTDLEEFNLAVTDATYPALSPTMADTDGDGRNDGDEVNGVVGPPAIPATNPLNPDNDGDGLYDGAETNTGIYDSYDFETNTGDTGSNPTLVDSDADELDDGFEVINYDPGYDPNFDDSDSDYDDDSSTVAEELLAGTDVLLPDTDGDGFYDGAETNDGSFNSYDYGSNTGDTGTDPLVSDTDGDGLLDGVESGTEDFVDEDNTGTDPNDPDSDGDSFEDGAEIRWGSNPNDAEDFPTGFVYGYTETGGDWMTMGTNDIDGSGGLGTDGFIFFGDFTGVIANGQPFTLNVASSPLPSYLVSYQAGDPTDFASVATGYAPYGKIDNPILLDGTDQITGFAVATGGGAGTILKVMEFEIGALAAGQVVRVGVMGGVEGNADGRWDPTEIWLAGPGEYKQGGVDLEANPGGVNVGWLFFDIDTAGIYTVAATRRNNLGAGTGISGLTFDSTGGGLELAISNNPNGTDLDFSWPGEAGKLYDILRSTDLSTDPATWSIWQTDIPADASGTNMETYKRPDDSKSFFVLVEKDVPPVYAENFDGVTAPALPEGWMVDGTAGDPTTAWELGTPDSSGFELPGPSAAFSGENCVGTNLTALYGPDAVVTLTSPAIEVPATVATLRFRQVVEIDGPNVPLGGGADLGTLRVLDSSNDSELAVLELEVEGSTSGSWSVYSVSMPEVTLGKSVKLEFEFSSDSNAGAVDTYERAGWYIDDVELLEK